MKKLFILFFAFLLPFISMPASYVTKANHEIFAKVEKENVYFYSSPVEDSEKRMFILPQSYFIKLLDEAGKSFYFCSYKDLKGYVKKNEVIPMNGTPVQPYVQGMIRVFSFEGLGMYSTPFLKSDKCLTKIPYLTDDLIFYGSILGEEVIPDKSKEWIYCKYNAQYGICGYVYAVFCDKPQIFENSERYPTIENPFKEKTISPKQLSPVAMGFIIMGVALPCIIVLFLLIKPTFLKEKLNTARPKLKVKRHKDFFEFDDSDLN